MWGQDISPWGKVGTWQEKGNLEINREQSEGRKRMARGGVEKGGAREDTAREEGSKL